MRQPGTGLLCPMAVPLAGCCEIPPWQYPWLMLQAYSQQCPWLAGLGLQASPMAVPPTLHEGAVSFLAAVPPASTVSFPAAVPPAWALPPASCPSR